MARADFDIVDPKPIGTGQFGIVYLARRGADGAPVALKLVLRKSAGVEGLAAERHGAILQQRFAERHGMVPEVYDHGADGDDFYIAMELVDGPSLEDLLRSGPLPPEPAVGHAIWLCEFLEKAHGFSSTVEGKPYRLLHNDLKPAHLKIAASGERKVLDFGIAKALEETRELATDVARTIAYAAPERLTSERVNVHADFWSLGVMLYEMICGHRPYRALDDRRFRRQLYHAITTNAPREPLPPACPPPLAAIVYKLLAFQPEHRYQSAADIRADLERFTRGETPEAMPYFETPATVPVTRAATQPVTDIVPPSSISSVPPTDPVPPGGGSAGVGVVDAVVAPAATRSVAQQSRFARVMWTLMLLALVATVATEGVAWLVAERFRSTIPLMDERSIASRRDAYAAVDRWAIFDVGLRARVNGELRQTLRAAGERVINDYRNETPAVGAPEWTRAYDTLTWARELSPRDRELRARQLVAEGHVRRLASLKGLPAARAAAAQSALSRFREAASADDRSYDPYLGMAVTQVYSLGDVDGAAAAIQAAIDRGYASTRRETALLGDGYLRRGLASIARARQLTGEQRYRELIKAREDFERCVALFDSIVEFGDAFSNMRRCRQQIQAIERLLYEDEGY